MKVTEKRAGGVLLHISSLPSKYGIGTLGKNAYEFVDRLKKAGQKYWQILPLNPTSFGDSPYQSFSTFAGNPYFIDLDALISEGFLSKDECDGIFWGNDAKKVDFKSVFEGRKRIYSIIYQNFTQNVPKDFENFCKENDLWLSDYALFMAIKDSKFGASFDVWEDGIKKREEGAIAHYSEELKDTVQMYKMLQYFFFKQWRALKNYANLNGIKIIGDLPIYVSLDSADVWSCPEQFDLNEDLVPNFVAGCPPDAFSSTGQLWGNPVYNWEYIKNDGYRWWISRLKKCLEMYDAVRIDHFRGFESFYCIPYGDKTAENGFWRKGPDMSLFDAAKNVLGDMDIIAEDLGFLTPEVYELLGRSGYPGMNVLQFAFDKSGESKYMPNRHIENSVVYTGTHDNTTLKAWIDEENRENVRFAKKTLGVLLKRNLPRAMMLCALKSRSALCILTMQDLLSLGKEGRMNTPSTDENNWSFRITERQLNAAKYGFLKKYTRKYGR